MPRGIKQSGPVEHVPQDEVILRATKALAVKRATIVRLPLKITFTAPLLMNPFAEKAVVEMLSKQVGAPTPREHKDLTRACEDAVYRNVDGDVAIPCRMVKACIVEGAICTAGAVTKADLKRVLRVEGWTAPIALKGELVHDVRLTRNANGSPDLRGRSMAPEGSSFEVVLSFPNDFSVDKIMAATTAAGERMGLGDWRPDKGGIYGTFEVDVISDQRRIAAIIKACQVPEKTFEIPEWLMHAVGATPAAEKPGPVRKAIAVARQNGAAGAGTPAR